MTADIASLGVSVHAEAIMEVRGLDGETLRHDDGRPFTITLLSQDNDAYVRLARQQADRRLQQMARTRTPALTGTTEQEQIELLVAVTVKWDLCMGGEPFESAPREYRRLYATIPALREQVAEFTGVRKNFLTG